MQAVPGYEDYLTLAVCVTVLQLLSILALTTDGLYLSVISSTSILSG